MEHDIEQEALAEIQSHEETPSSQMQVQPRPKRHLSTSSSSSISNAESTLQNQAPIFQTPTTLKRSKTDIDKPSTIDLSNHLQPAKEHINANVDDYPVSFDKLKEFLEISYKLPEDNIVSKVSDYTDDTTGFNNMLNETLKLVNNRTLCRKIKRIKTLLIPSALDDGDHNSRISGQGSETDESVH
ncbi:hypothetical protein QAD02_024300 [Eretmocerus hayati]|uniref:Uncharacterized protein n=1 Tax=Eretmocerus hayati TaxID=131215 RepID=A0ACC2PYL0_9HYME|nr:hypothetical protein QAD02_024300 [Eretmocerus hayati]